MELKTLYIVILQWYDGYGTLHESIVSSYPYENQAEDDCETSNLLVDKRSGNKYIVRKFVAVEE